MSVYRKYAQLANNQVKETLAEEWIVIPAGSIEQHGRNLPLSVDLDITKAIAKKLCKERRMILAPEIIYGARSFPNTGGGAKFAGNIFISGTDLIPYFADILKCYIRNGAHKIMILNGHFENYIFLCDAAEELEKELDIVIVVFNWWDVLSESYMKEITHGRFKNWELEHAGIAETALELYIKPKLVRGIKYREKISASQNIYSRGVEGTVSNTGALSGNIGATRKLGKKLMKKILKRLGRAMDKLESKIEESSDGKVE